MCCLCRVTSSASELQKTLLKPRMFASCAHYDQIAILRGFENCMHSGVGRNRLAAQGFLPSGGDARQAFPRLVKFLRSRFRGEKSAKRPLYDANGSKRQL